MSVSFPMLDDRVAVSGQLRPGDMTEIAAAGFVAVVNNRPDGESPDQPDSATIERAAHEAGLSYHYIPLGRDGVNSEMIDQTKQVLEGSAGSALDPDVVSAMIVLIGEHPQDLGLGMAGAD